MFYFAAGRVLDLPLLDTLEKHVALTAIVADLETLQRRLRDLIKFREIDN